MVTRMKKADDEPNLRGRDPRKPFFMVVSVGNLDGSFDAPEGCEAMKDTFSEAEEHAQAVNGEYADLECYIFECKPVAKIARGKMKTTKLSGK